MEKNKLKYRKYAAFINRQKELRDLKAYIDEEPESILFLHGPKSSGKTTLLYKFFDQIQEEQKLDVKFMDLRKTFTNVYEDFLKAFFRVETKGEKKEKLGSNINVGFFKIDATVETKILQKRVDPFKVMETELLDFTRQGIKPVLIVDELQALDKIYLDNDKERQLIAALFNFFVAMTKQSHLAHIIIASSDGYFLNRVHTDSKLKKCSEFYKVDYLPKADVIEWLLNLEKYSRIRDYTLGEEEVEKIWNVMGGSMWEIQSVLTKLFDTPLDEALENFKQKMQGIITDYIVTIGRKDREKILGHFITHDRLFKKDIDETDEELLKDMVTNNILYFDPARAVYYPQGKSYHWGIRLYFESIGHGT
jgi:AAA+ ATPase superfamily predicted ATPase